MRVGLFDIDGKIPNLALMKLSTWHKARGDSVELSAPVFAGSYDIAYASKVFTWTDAPGMPDYVQTGGTGYDLTTTLPEEVENTCPDYSLYRMDYSMGFLTRGCIRKCSFCFVPEKEGMIKPAADIEDFLRHKKAVLLDNNVLAHEHGLRQIEKIGQLAIKVDFNQGLDARLIDDGVAKLLSGVKWLKPIRLACDNLSMVEPVRKAVGLLRKHGATPKQYNCYVLVQDIPTAIERVEFLRGLNVSPFAQPIRTADGSEPARELKQFARWVNRKELFKSCKWSEFKGGDTD